MSYIVNFEGTGWTAPTPENPKGIKVKGRGTITVQGTRPAKNSGIPWSVLKAAAKALMEECHLVRMDGDTETRKHGPTVWLGKKIKEPSHD